MPKEWNVDENSFSFFENDSEESKTDSKVFVVEAEYKGAQSVTWQELFSGYDHLLAITYSSGLSFVCDLLSLFEDAEVLFGNENVMSYSLQTVMAYQNAFIDTIRNTKSGKKKKLLDRIEKGTVRFYVARRQLSHEKIYLLSSNDGRKRVIMGSANMSSNAFCGHQRENICYMDGEEAYSWYYDIFESLKETSTDKIARGAIEESNLEDNIEKLPVMETAKINRVLEIVPENNKELIEFQLRVDKNAEAVKRILPKTDDKTGRISLTPDKIVKMQRQKTEEIVREKELTGACPELIVCVEEKKVTLNGKPLLLSPKKEEVAHDVNLFVEYMKGYEQFHGDWKGMQQRYYEFANWFFCSPFMATMREWATRYDQNRLPYPVFGLVYGQSKAGKTSFLETLLKMMIGQKPKMQAPDFTRTYIENLKRQVKGAPIIVDDLTNTRFNQHAIESIKTDDFGVVEHMIDYPAVVISANEDVKAVAPEVIRRTVICRVEAGLTNTETMKSNVVRTVHREIGTALYREYLARMLEIVPLLIDEMRQDKSDAPDILKYSSEVLFSIINENTEQMPDYVRELSLDDYFSERVTAKYAIKTIQTAWRVSPKSFDVKVKSNELRYYSGATYEADRIMKELPETLEAKRAKDCLILNLEQSKEFFGIDFKKSRGLFLKR
ncbi:MAG: phospholipase D family protein [Clostridia bacterium]|nr:phospholipase D family protein [Clostridia bacterium]